MILRSPGCRVSVRAGFLAWAILFALGSGSRAQEQGTYAGGGEETVEDAEDDVIMVTGSRIGKPQVTVVASDDLAAEGQNTTVEGRLENLAGVDVNRRSLSGNESSRLTIRGLDESRLQVQLNGRSLHGSGVYGGYYVDWASLSLEDVESVEVIRGVAPAKYGNTIGGVVNVVPGEPDEEPRTVLQTAFGSLATWDTQASFSAGAGSLLYGIAAGHFETDGYLRDSSLDRTTFSARTAVELPRDFKLAFSGKLTSNECGMTAYNMPDAYDYDPDYPDSLGDRLGGPNVGWINDATGPLYWGAGSYWKDRRLQLDLGISRTSQTRDFSFQTYLMDQDREEYFYANDDPSLLVLERTAEPEDGNFGWRTDLENVFEGLSKHVLQYGAEGQYLGYGDANVVSFDPAYFTWAPTDSPGKDTVTKLHGAYVQDTWSASDRLELHFGVRMDDYVADGPEANALYIHETPVSPRVACNWKAWEGGRLTARCGQAYRFPTNPEYYWWYAGYDPSLIGVDRKDLTSEKANQIELEVAHESVNGSSVVLRGYRYKVDDYIRTIFGYPMGRVVYNVDRVDFDGIEIETACNISREFRIWANYTYLDTEKHGDILDNSTAETNELLDLPENKINFGIAYRHANGFDVRLKLRYVSERWEAMGNLAFPGAYSFHKMDGFVDVDILLSCPVWRGDSERKALFTFAVENLLDQEIVEEYGYPHPGTTVMAGVRAEF